MADLDNTVETAKDFRASVNEITKPMRPGFWGKAFANATLSDDQRDMVKAAGAAKHQRDAEHATTLERIGVTPEKIAKGVLNEVVSGSPITKPIKIIGGVIEVAENHKLAIEGAVKEGMPGFSYNEVKVGGYTQRVWVDASNYGEKPSIYMQPQSPLEGGGQKEAKQFKALKQAGVDEAADSRDAYVEKHGISAYENKVESFVRDGLSDRVAEVLEDHENAYASKRAATLGAAPAMAPGE